MKRRKLIISGRAHQARRGGFTLIEVLATLLLVGIVLPTVMQGVSISTQASTFSRRHAEAAGLAEQKMNEILASADFSGGGNSSGDFTDEWAGYHWEYLLVPFNDNNVQMQQLDVKVSWLSRGDEDSIVISTLVYTKASQ